MKSATVVTLQVTAGDTLCYFGHHSNQWITLSTGLCFDANHNRRSLIVAFVKLSLESNK